MALPPYFIIDFKEELIVEGCLAAFLLPFGLSLAAEEVVIAARVFLQGPIVH
jgi:hypothetical protein